MESGLVFTRWLALTVAGMRAGIAPRLGFVALGFGRLGLARTKWYCSESFTRFISLCRMMARFLVVDVVRRAWGAFLGCSPG